MLWIYFRTGAYTQTYSIVEADDEKIKNSEPWSRLINRRILVYCIVNQQHADGRQVKNIVFFFLPFLFDESQNGDNDLIFQPVEFQAALFAGSCGDIKVKIRFYPTPKYKNTARRQESNASGRAKTRHAPVTTRGSFEENYTMLAK